MRVRLLGTGSADGWPNAFCRCARCLTALNDGTLRGPTSALVDGRILLDCGPETPRAALRYERGLSSVSHILITHDHPDHSAPMALLSRTWAARRDLITVIGPAQVVESWRQWCGPDDPVRFVPVGPGSRLAATGYDIRVLPARHHTWGTRTDHPHSPDGADHASAVTCVLYDVTAPDGSRLLYATDTGPLPADALDAAHGAAYDIALIEATYGDRDGPGRPAREHRRDHLDLDDLAGQLTILRRCGALTDRSQVAAVHLSHQSPPDLRSRLDSLGVLLLDDGAELTCDGPQQAPHVPTMPRRTLVLGGARSGKSVTAEHLLAGEPRVTYVATGAIPTSADPEWADRVLAHQRRRPEHWTTVETTDLAETLTQACTAVLVDCLGTWLTAVLDEVEAWTRVPGWRERLDAHLDGLVEAWHAVAVPVVAVTNEVGSGVVPASASGRLFRDELGRLNTRLSRASEQVLLVTAGRVLALPASGPPPRRQPSRSSAAPMNDAPEAPR